MTKQSTISFSYTEGATTVTDSKVIDVAQVPASIALSGPATVQEGGNTLQVSAVVTYTDNTTAAVTAANWTVDVSAAASVSGTGLVTTEANVAASTPVIVSCSYTEGGTTVNSTHTITVLDDVKPASAAISGPATIQEGLTGNLAFNVTYDDTSSGQVVVTDWASDNAALVINATTGAISTADVTVDTVVNVTASYTSKGVTVNDTHAVTVLATLPASLAISGPVTVNAAETIQLVSTVTNNDATSSVVTGTTSWSSNSVDATVSPLGVVTGRSDLATDANVTITASYTKDGTTVNDTHSVAVTAPVASGAPGPMIFRAGFAGPLGDAKGDASWQEFIDNHAIDIDQRPSMAVPYDFQTDQPGLDDFIYVMWPNALGGPSVGSYEVIFDRDTNFAGGMDGQHWPTVDDISFDNNSLPLTYNGELWNMIRVDYPAQGVKLWRLIGFPKL